MNGVKELIMIELRLPPLYEGRVLLHEWKKKLGEVIQPMVDEETFQPSESLLTVKTPQGIVYIPSPADVPMKLVDIRKQEGEWIEEGDLLALLEPLDV